MRILVVAATMEEIDLLISELRITNYDSNPVGRNEAIAESDKIVNRKSEIVNLSQNISVLLTGVGMVATAFELGRHLVVNTYDLAINLGIAGSFDHDIAFGDIFEITEDTFSELGAEDDGEFLSIDKMGFGEGRFSPTARFSNHFNTFNLKQATAITVNTVHGNDDSIKKVTERLNPQLESMEGAAFFYACAKFNLPCLQIRAVSNYVEKRDRSNWNIGLAIKNLNSFAVEFLKTQTL